MVRRYKMKQIMYTRFTKAIFIYMVGLIFIAILAIVLFSDDVIIENYHADITLDDAGNMLVEEQWDINYKQVKYDKFRNINYNKTNEYESFEQPGYNVAIYDEVYQSVQVLDANQKDITSSLMVDFSTMTTQNYNQSEACFADRNNCEYIYIDASKRGGLKGKYSFKYTYKILGAVTEYTDISELNWVLFERLESNVKQVTVDFYLPMEILKEELRLFGHGFSVGDHPLHMMSKHIRTGAALEFRLLLPNDVFPNIENRNVVIKSDFNKQAILKEEVRIEKELGGKALLENVILGVSIASIFVMGGLMFLAFKKYDREYHMKKKLTLPLPNDMSPAEINYLMNDKKITDDAIIATIIDLVHKQYIELQYQNEVIVLKRIKNKEVNALNPHEKYLLNWFLVGIGDGNKVTIDQISQYSSKGEGQTKRWMESEGHFKKSIKRLVSSRRFYEQGLGKEKAGAYGYLLVPLLVAGLNVFITMTNDFNNRFGIFLQGILIIMFLVYLGTIQKRSVLGNKQYGIWLAWKEYFEEEVIEDAVKLSAMDWEYNLVFATSLQIFDKVYQRIPTKDLDLEDTTFLKFHKEIPFMIKRLEEAYQKAKQM